MTSTASSPVSAPVSRAYAGAADQVPHGVLAGQQVADVTAEEVVVFLVGMRINRWRRVRSWFPVFQAMPTMLAELGPDTGLLGARSYWSGRTFTVVQYWTSVEALGAYARDSRKRHAPAWARFNASGGASSGDVGVFHETYAVPRGAVESRYLNMPPSGLGAAFRAVPRSRRPRRTTADERMGVVDPPATTATPAQNSRSSALSSPRSAS